MTKRLEGVNVPSTPENRLYLERHYLVLQV